MTSQVEEAASQLEFLTEIQSGASNAEFSFLLALMANRRKHNPDIVTAKLDDAIDKYYTPPYPFTIALTAFNRYLYYDEIYPGEWHE